MITVSLPTERFNSNKLAIRFNHEISKQIIKRAWGTMKQINSLESKEVNVFM
jgi:hypothetical protein